MQATITALLLLSGDPVIVPVHTIRWPRGADGTLEIQVIDESGAPVNLSGGALSLGFSGLGDALAGGRAAAVTDADSGRARVTIAASDTDALAAGTAGRWDAWLDDANGRHQVIRPGAWLVLEAVLSSGDDPGAGAPITAAPSSAVDTLAALAALDALRFGDGFALWVRETRCYYHVEIGRGLTEDGVLALPALNLVGGQWVRGLGI